MTVRQRLALSFRMLRRDLRAGELGLLLVALVIAVASLTSVGFFTDRVGRGLNRQASQLLGGDLLIAADHPLAPDLRAEAARRGLASVESTTFTSMASLGDATQLVGVKSVEAGHPLRGEIRIAPGLNQPDAPARGIPAPGEVWLDERSATALGAHPGDLVGLGRSRLRMAAVLSFEADRGANFFALLPRIVMNAADLPATGLIVPGSRVTYRLHLAGSIAAVQGYEAWAKARLGRGESLESVDNARPEIRATLDRTERFLRFAAMLAVVLAAVAVGLATRRFVERHLDGCAVMRVLGARQAQVLGIVVGEFLLFGLAAALAGTALGWAVQWGLAGGLRELLATDLPAPSPLPLAHGLVVGMALLAGFVLPQLLRLGKVSTLRVLRREFEFAEPVSGAAWALGLAALLGLIFWIAADARLGAMVAAGFAVALGVFALAAWGVLRLAGRLKGQGSLRGGGWRYGIAALGRRMGSSVIQAAALGLGMTALLLLTLVRADLLDNWRRMAPPDAPNRFVINIQPDQRAGICRLLHRAGPGCAATRTDGARPAGGGQ